MAGETNLNTLLRTMTADLAEEVYGFATLPKGRIPAGAQPRMVFHEAEGTTLILTLQEMAQFGLSYEFPCRMITLTVHSSLEAVGFIAVIASELAKHGMGVNPVSAFFHDHLFVPEGREQDAMRIIENISRNAKSAD